MSSAGANTWNVPLEINNLESQIHGGGGGGVASITSGNSNITITGTATNPIISGTLTNLTNNVNTSNYSFTGNASGNPSFVLGGGQEFKVITTDLTPQILVSGTGVSLGSSGSGYTVVAPTVASTANDTQVATTAFVKTAIAGSAVASVSAGTNITITGTSTAPIVNLSSPLTSQLNVGAQNITTTTLNQPINLVPNGDGGVIVSVNNAGGANLPALQINNTNGNANAVHIDVYRNSASPAVNDGLGTISFHGNSSTGVKREYANIATTIGDPTNTSENGIMSLTACVNSSTPSEFFRVNGLTNNNELYKFLETRGNYIQNTTAGQNLVLYQNQGGQNISLNHTGNSGAISLSQSGTSSQINLNASGTNSAINILASNTGSAVNITGGNSVNIASSAGGISLVAQTGSGILTNQTNGNRTILRTGLPVSIATQPVDYYPAVHIDNNNANSVSVEDPKIPYQTLTVINNGISPAIQFQDVSNSYSSGYDSIAYIGGYVWLASGGNIYIVDAGYGTLYQTITLAGSSSGSSTRALCYYYANPYVYVGGDFTSVNGNAQPQYGLTRIYIGGGVGSYYEDPIYDSSTGSYGVNGYVNTISEFGGNLFVGGNFGSIAGSGNTAQNGMRVQNFGGSGGSQLYDNDSGQMGFNGEVFCSCSNGSFIFFGGNFSQVGSGSYSYPYFSAYNGGTWIQCDNNQFNGVVYACGVSQLSPHILCAGDFTQNGFSNVCYVDGSSPSSSAYNAGFSPSTTTRGGVSCMGGIDMVVNADTSTYTSGTYQSWNYLGQANGGYVPSGCYYSGVAYVSFGSYGYVRQSYNVSQACSFALPTTHFYYGGNYYQTATLNTKGTAQQFVSNSGGIIYIPVGTPICSFS